MTFLNPLVLIGLAAASIPLILHLLNLRRPRTIEFSTLSFLKELQQSSIRRLKLRQILLLIVRTALIVAIILAFARPVLRGSLVGIVGTHARTSVVILIDDTFSLSASDERGMLLKQAKEKALELIGLLKEGDEVCVLRFSDLPNQTMERMTHDVGVCRRLVDEISITMATASMEEAIRIAAKTLSASKNANKEVYVLTDGQQSAFSRNPRLSTERIFSADTKVWMVELGSRETENAAADSVGISSRIFEPGRPIAVVARVSNYGKLSLRDHVVSIYLEGRRVAQRNTDVSPNSSSLVEFFVIPPRAGFVRGHVGIEDDAIEYDNKRFFHVYIPEKISIATIAPSRDDIRYVLLSLTASGGGSAAGLFTVQNTTPQQFPLLDLAKVDAVIVSNVRSFPASDVSRLRAFVERGGGLIIFPGESLDEANYNSVLLPGLRLPPFEGRLGSTETSGPSSMTFERVDTDHPLFMGMFEPTERGKKLSPETPQVYTAMKQRAGRHGRTIISLPDQIPFLSEYRLGDGTVMLFASPPTLRWTDFPIKGMFAPLMHRTALYASARTREFRSFHVGESPTVRLAGRSVGIGKPIILVSPSGVQEILPHQTQPSPIGSAVTVQLPRLMEAGNYEVDSGDDVATIVSVNTFPPESDLRKISRDDARVFVSQFGIEEDRVSFASAGDRLEAMVLQSRYGVELWKSFLIAALILAVVEMLLGRESRKRAVPQIVQETS
jgi:hypothetical protein